MFIMINSQTAFKYTLYVLGAMAIIAFLSWTTERDKKAMEFYENCQWVEEVLQDGSIKRFQDCG